MKRPLVTGAALLAALLVLRTAEPASAAPPNDHFADASVIASVPFTTVTDSGGATREPGEPFVQFPAPTVWYRWAASSSGFYLADACGEFSSNDVGVYTGDNLFDLSRVSEFSFDDAGPGCLPVKFKATAGTVYHLQLAGVEQNNHLRLQRARGQFRGLRVAGIERKLGDVSRDVDHQPVPEPAAGGRVRIEAGDGEALRAGGRARPGKVR